MERKKERCIKSIFDCLNKSREFEKQILSPKNIINNLELPNNDFINIEEYINYLRNSVSKPKTNINKIITQLESYLEAGNNSNNINKLFYCSKIFIDCVDLLKFSHSDYRTIIFDLLEKILNIKHISKFKVENKILLPLIIFGKNI